MRRTHAAALFETLRADSTAYAVRDEHMLEWMCDVFVGVGFDTDIPVTTAGQRASNWRAWERYIAAMRAGDPQRPTLALCTPLEAQREHGIWTAALPWIYARMSPAPGRFLPNGQPQPPKPCSAMAILRGVAAEHRDRGVAVPSLALAARRSHALMLRYRNTHGPEALLPQKKAPLTHRIILNMLAIPPDAPLRFMAGMWSWETDFGESVRALWHTLAQTGFRKAEVALDPREAWGAQHLSWANVTWRIGGVHVPCPTAAQLLTLVEGDYCVLVPPPSKADQFGMRWGSNPIWLPYSSRGALNAARALARWEVRARVPLERRRATPLFCGVGGVGTPALKPHLDNIFARMIEYIVGKEEAKMYSMHSWRSFLASSMAAAGIDDASIQAALRWASTEALAEYKKTEPKVAGDRLLRAEGMRLTARMAHHLPRPPPRHDADDLASAILASRQELLADGRRHDDAAAEATADAANEAAARA